MKKFDYKLALCGSVLGVLLTCFICFKVIPDYRKAVKADNERFYGRETYAVWVKLNPGKELTYEEWVRAKWARLIE